MSALELIETAAAPRRLLSSSTKTVKGLKVGVGTAVMYLAPADSSGHNVCPLATDECRFACLKNAGMLRFKASQDAQLARTLMLYQDRSGFLAKLEHEISLHEKRCYRDGLRPAVRLNGTSDLRWERIAPDLFERFPRIKFYDYTKLPNRRDLPRNYSLTFSLAETDRFVAAPRARARDDERCCRAGRVRKQSLA